MTAAQIIENNDRMFRELFGIDVGLHDLAARVAGARGMVVADTSHSALCIAAGLCTCRLPTEEEAEAAR